MPRALLYHNTGTERGPAVQHGAPGRISPTCCPCPCAGEPCRVAGAPSVKSKGVPLTGSTSPVGMRLGDTGV